MFRREAFAKIVRRGLVVGVRVRISGPDNFLVCDLERREAAGFFSPAFLDNRDYLTITFLDAFTYMTLQRVDGALLEPRLPPQLFYNLVLSAEKPA